MLYSLWGQTGPRHAAFFFVDASHQLEVTMGLTCRAPETLGFYYARIGSKNLGTHYVNKSFIRLDNITVSYRLPQKWTKVVGIQDLRFNASIHNGTPLLLTTTVGILNQIAQWKEHSIFGINFYTLI